MICILFMLSAISMNKFVSCIQWFNFIWIVVITFLKHFMKSFFIFISSNYIDFFSHVPWIMRFFQFSLFPDLFSWVELILSIFTTRAKVIIKLFLTFCYLWYHFFFAHANYCLLPIFSLYYRNWQHNKNFYWNSSQL